MRQRAIVAAVMNVVDDAVDNGNEVPGQPHDQAPARQLVGAQMDSTPAGQVPRRREPPAEALQVRTVDRVHDAVVGMEEADIAPAPRPPSVGVRARRHASNLGDFRFGQVAVLGRIRHRAKICS
jgi:hypothetical protein